MTDVIPSDLEVADLVKLYEAMQPEQRREALRQLAYNYCFDCGVPHGSQCKCWKGWIKCAAI